MPVACTGLQDTVQVEITHLFDNFDFSQNKLLIATL